MKLIVGLGNPGDIYKNSRHNIGFLVVKELAGTKKAALKKEFGIKSLSAKTRINHEVVILALPLTYMNLSGNAVKRLLGKYKLTVEDLLVICDDMDLEFGRLKIRPSGSSGGHNGLESIIGSLGSNCFARLRLGIGRPAPHEDAAEFVLSDFSSKEKKEIKEIIAEAVECSESWVTNGTSGTMNVFNKKEKRG